ncbi:histidine phosphatase family protein [Iamia sp. SCSIO 61187]|uniref:histidine phosphatase family protein n=1 Tax=Iamia sp. SCSIO 61187 TaxID=2722752 RepID=UPI001C63AFBA|nr:histidine phosphatase family protein [Iamia sp. SCSIO 61187]QYG92859.1 histidine phosphatase family protein [Iamia sp. SCSIO 61187]
MELLLVRHALPVRLEGAGVPADPHLSAEGRDQAERLAAVWAGDVDAVWTSPLQRARETAAPLAAALGVEAVVDDDLAEMDRDADAYIPLEELRRDPLAWAEAVEAWVGPEGAALRAAFRRRVVAAVDRIVAAHRGQRVAVVCHGGTINAALAEVLGLEEQLFFEPGYTSVSRVLAGAGGARQVLSVNETWHWDRRAT